MNIGRLDRRVKLQAQLRTSDGAGGVTVAWSDVVTVWASIEPASGREAYAAQQLQGRVTHQVRMRYRSGVTTGMRLVYGTRAFDIQSAVDEKGEGRSLLLTCEEIL